MVRAQGLLFCGLALRVAMSSLLLPVLTEGGQLLLISGLILSLGVPHGAIDTIFAYQVYRLRTPRAWLLAAIIYGGLAALVVCAWLISPTVFLIGFLLLSIAHFAGDPQKGVRAFTRILYAGMVIVLPCLRFEPDVARLFEFLAGPTSATLLAATLAVLAWPWLACSLGAAVVESGRNWRVGGEVLAVVLPVVSATPLIAFTAYFCGMHSARHVIRTYHYANQTSIGLLVSDAAAPMLLVLAAASTSEYAPANGNKNALRAIRSVRISVERRERMPDREISMSVGALRSQDDDLSKLMASLRTDWRLRRWLRSELGMSYAIGSIDQRRNGSESARVEQTGGLSVAF